MQRGMEGVYGVQRVHRGAMSHCYTKKAWGHKGLALCLEESAQSSY